MYQFVPKINSIWRAIFPILLSGSIRGAANEPMSAAAHFRKMRAEASGY